MKKINEKKWIAAIIISLFGLMLFLPTSSGLFKVGDDDDFWIEDGCQIISPNGGEEIWGMCEVQWKVNYTVPELNLVSRVNIGCIFSENISTPQGNQIPYSVELYTGSLDDGMYKARVQLFLDVDEDGIPDEPEHPAAEDESDEFFTIINGPYPPLTPTGPANGRPEQAYTFTTSTTHNSNKNVFYMFSWGDGTNSSWLGPYTPGINIVVNHSWDEKGPYVIRARAMDTLFKKSDWSEPLVLDITQQAPLTPSFTGPTSGTPNVSYTFEISSEDPDGDDVYYLIDWYHEEESSWLGPFNSDEVITVDHVFPSTGSYILKVKAKDIFDDESEWASLEITMPKSKHYQKILIRLFQDYPLLLKIFNRLIY